MRFFRFVVVCLLCLTLVRESVAQSTALTSPAYGTYNTFIDGLNILELVSTGTESISATVSVYRQDGSLRNRTVHSIDPKSQVDIDINSVVGASNRYGVIVVTFDDSDTDKGLIGRVTVYRQNISSDDYSFAYTQPLSNASTGTTYSISNSFDPQGANYDVLNWASVVNLGETSQTFRHNLYDQNGSVVSTTSFALEQYERLDISARVEGEEGVYINEFVPQDSTSTEYLAFSMRYRTRNFVGGNFTGKYRFAMPSAARSGSGADLFALVSNQTGNCFRETNWVEVANVGSATSTVTVTFYKSSGELADTSSVTLPALSQFHFNASSVISAGEFGSVKISPGATTDKILARSAVYVRSCQNSTLHAGYSVPASAKKDLFLTGSYNNFLSMGNKLYLVNATTETKSPMLEVRSSNETLYMEEQSLAANQTLELDITGDAGFGTEADTFGVLSLSPEDLGSFLAYTLRSHFANNDSDRVDFIVPTVFEQ